MNLQAKVFCFGVKFLMLIFYLQTNTNKNNKTRLILDLKRLLLYRFFKIKR